MPYKDFYTDHQMILQIVSGNQFTRFTNSELNWIKPLIPMREDSLEEAI